MMNLNNDPTTIRILTLDGGGMRGIYSMTGLNAIIEQAMLPQNALNTVFDVIAGTSIGGIASLGLSTGLTANYIKQILIDKGKLIFDASEIPFIGQRHASWSDKVAFILGLESSLYSNSILHQEMQEIFAERKMSSITGCTVLVPSVKYTYLINAGDVFPRNQESASYFSNKNLQGLTGQDFLISDVAMATSAAPMYLPPWTIGADTYLDGGLLQNNMGAFAFSLASQIKPKATKAVVLSIGTGLGNIGVARSRQETDAGTMPAGYELLLDAMSLAIALPQESSEHMLRNFANGAGITMYHYRFNKVLDPSVDCELDSTDDEAISYLQDEANATLSADQEEIQLFAQHLK